MWVIYWLLSEKDLILEIIVSRIAYKSWYPQCLKCITYGRKTYLKRRKSTLNAVHLFGTCNMNSCLVFNLWLWQFQWEYLLVESSDRKTTCSLQFEQWKRILSLYYMSNLCWCSQWWRTGYWNCNRNRLGSEEVRFIGRQPIALVEGTFFVVGNKQGCWFMIRIINLVKAVA